MKPKSIVWSQTYIPFKCLEIFGICRNNSWLIENHGPKTNNDKMCADSSTGNTPNISQFIQPICPNRPIIWDIFQKKLSSHVHCPCAQWNSIFEWTVTKKKIKIKNVYLIFLFFYRLRRVVKMNWQNLTLKRKKRRKKLPNSVKN